MKKTYMIEVDCAACAAKMEHAIGKLPGVCAATVNFMTQKLSIDFEEGADVSSILDAAVKACKKVEPDCVIYR